MAPTDINFYLLLAPLLTGLGTIVQGQQFEDSFFCPKSFGTFPDGNSCSGYWLCTYDQSELMSCPQGLHYNPKKSNCDRPDNAPCMEHNGVAFRLPYSSDFEESTPMVKDYSLYETSSEIIDSDIHEMNTENPVFLRKRINFHMASYESTLPPLTTPIRSAFENNMKESTEPIFSDSIIAEKTGPLNDDNQELPITSSELPKTYTVFRVRGRPQLFIKRNRTRQLMFKPTTHINTMTTTTITTPTTPTQSNFPYLYEYDENEESRTTDMVSNEVEYDIATTTQPTVTTKIITSQPTTRKKATLTSRTTTKRSTTTRTTTITPTNSKKTLLGRKLRKFRTTTPPPEYDYEQDEGSEVSTSTNNYRPKLTSYSEATDCDKAKCQLPNCRCGGTDIPGGFKKNEIPQIVMLTYDDAVNDNNYKYYEKIFVDSRINPNGCPIKGTFFNSHEWTSYDYVQTLYSKGHEFASHTIRHLNMKDFTLEEWIDEMVGQREILTNFGKLKQEDVKGIRAPFLQTSGDETFQMLYENNFLYDSSISIGENNPPYFPYTFDYRISHQCLIPPCPKKSFPGIWEVPAVNYDGKGGEKCSMIDGCKYPDDPQAINETLYKNFMRHYSTNRAPLPFFVHAVWYENANHEKGFMKFLETINALPDVYIVTISQMLEWMKNPTPLSKIKSFDPWKCDKKDLPEPCTDASSCTLKHESETRYMRTCSACPSVFPWVHNTNGEVV